MYVYFMGSYTVKLKFIKNEIHTSNFFNCIGFKQVFQQKQLLNTFLSSTLGGFAVAVCMTPFDVVMTRLYNQGK